MKEIDMESKVSELIARIAALENAQAKYISDLEKLQVRYDSHLSWGHGDQI